MTKFMLRHAPRTFTDVSIYDPEDNARFFATLEDAKTWAAQNADGTIEWMKPSDVYDNDVEFTNYECIGIVYHTNDENEEGADKFAIVDTDKAMVG